MNTEPEDENLAIEELFRLNELEKSWRKTLPKPHDSIWIETFTEAKEIIPFKIQEWQEQSDQISNGIKQKLIDLNKITKDVFSYWFFREWIKINDGAKLVEAKKHIKRLKWLIVDKSRLTDSSISPNDIQRAKEVPLVEVAEAGIRLRRTGKTYTGICPFHQEKHASFFIYPESNTFVCFSCQKKGDVIDFIMAIKNLTFIEAIRWLLKGIWVIARSSLAAGFL